MPDDLSHSRNNKNNAPIGKCTVKFKTLGITFSFTHERVTKSK